MWMVAFVVTHMVIAAVIAHPHHYHYTLQDVPVQDQCKSVNATEPPECPATIGPPCPPCYTNFAPDYQSGDSITFDSTEKASIQRFMDWYIAWWPNNYPPSQTNHGYNIFLGSAGRANIFLRLYMYSHNETMLEMATQYLEHALSLLPPPNRQQYASYMYGNIGVWFLKAVIDQINNNQSSMQQYLSLIENTFTSVNQAIVDGRSTSSDGLDVNECTLDTGMAGMLYGALLINSHFEAEIIDTNIIANIVYHLLDIGISTGHSLNTDYLQYESFSDCYLWGPGHGSSGIVRSVYTAYNMYPTALAALFNTSTKYYSALKNTMDFYCSIQLEDGNMPTNTQGGCESHYGNDSDARVQWCHGAPGFINVFLEGSLLFASSDSAAATNYKLAGLRAMNSTWDRGLLVKGSMYCHGIGGNINMLWEAGYLLQKMSETELSNQAAWRAKQFVLWTLDWNNVNATRIYDSNEGWSMYQGNFALPMTYIQALQNGWPFAVSVGHPGWNLVV